MGIMYEEQNDSFCLVETQMSNQANAYLSCEKNHPEQTFKLFHAIKKYWFDNHLVNISNLHQLASKAKIKLLFQQVTVPLVGLKCLRLQPC